MENLIKESFTNEKDFTGRNKSRVINYYILLSYICDVTHKIEISMCNV